MHPLASWGGAERRSANEQTSQSRKEPQIINPVSFDAMAAVAHARAAKSRGVWCRAAALKPGGAAQALA